MLSLSRKAVSLISCCQVSCGCWETGLNINLQSQSVWIILFFVVFFLWHTEVFFLFRTLKTCDTLWNPPLWLNCWVAIFWLPRVKTSRTHWELKKGLQDSWWVEKISLPSAKIIIIIIIFFLICVLNVFFSYICLSSKEVLQMMVSY